MIARPASPLVTRALTLLILFSLATGCMKAGPKQEDLGPEVSVDTVNAVLAKAAQNADLSGLTKGQYLDFANTRRIENADTDTVMGSRRVEVLDRTDTATQAHFTTRITDAFRQEDGSFQILTTEDALWLNKTAGAASLPPVFGPPATSGPGPAPATNLSTLQRLLHVKDDAPAPQRTTFHHLQESDASLDIPDAVAAKPDCGGLSPCALPVHFVQFDMVLWQDSVNYQKISIDFGFTGRTPFIPFGSSFDQLTGVLVVDCRSTYVPVQGSSVYVRDCLTLDDFQK